MGAVLYKADFLYPRRDPPTWAINDDVGPYRMQNNHKNTSQSSKALQSPVIPQEAKAHRFPSPEIYDDYSQFSGYNNQSLHSSSSAIKQQQIDSRLKKKIILLPAENSGPIVVNLHSCAPGELKENSLEDIRNKFNQSRKSSVISINSHESLTIIKKKSLMPTIKQILEDTPVEQCPKYMEKSREAWRLQNYQKCIEYLELGLDACEKEHPTNYYEKGLYHKRLGSNYWRLYNEQQAIFHLKEARTFFEMQIDPDLREIAAVQNNLGIIFQQENNLQDSLDHFHKSLQLKRQFLPETHVQISKALNNIGLIQWSLNKKRQAVDSFGQALHINKISFGYNHHQVAKNYFNLSLCLFDVGEYSLWLDYHFQCLKIMRKIGLARSVDYKTWLKTFQVKLRELLALKKHSQELVIKSLGMMAMILQKDEQIQFMTSIKEDLMEIQ